MIIAKFNDYYIDGVNWFIRNIKKELGYRDIPGLTNNRVQAINVTGHHPLVQLVGNLIDPTTQVSFAGLLPAISVVENNETEEATTIGQGKRRSGIMTMEFVSEVRTNLSKMIDRNKEGLITDAQLTAIENSLSGVTTGLLTEIEEFFLRESYFVSFWAHTLEEATVVGNMLRAVLYDIRKAMIRNHAIDIHITTSKGLVNFNFGKIIYGQETEITFLNAIRNYTVTDEVVKDYTAMDVITQGKYRNTLDNTNVYIYNRP